MHKWQCTICKHLDHQAATAYQPVYRCSAYPKGIPRRFLYAEEPHIAPAPDQQGAVVFELLEEKAGNNL